MQTANTISVPKYGTIQCHHKWYGGVEVNRLLRLIANDRPELVTHQDYWGAERFFSWQGDAVDRLRKIHSKHCDKFFRNELTAPNDAYLPLTVPTPDHVIDRLFRHHVDYRGDGDDGCASKADYLAMCDEALAVAGLAPKMELAA